MYKTDKTACVRICAAKALECDGVVIFSDTVQDLIHVHREAGVVTQKEEDWEEEHLVILYERRLVLGHPCKSLVPAHTWKLLVPGVLGHPWK